MNGPVDPVVGALNAIIVAAETMRRIQLVRGSIDVELRAELPKLCHEFDTAYAKAQNDKHRSGQ